MNIYVSLQQWTYLHVIVSNYWEQIMNQMCSLRLLCDNPFLPEYITCTTFIAANLFLQGLWYTSLYWLFFLCVCVWWGCNAGEEIIIFWKIRQNVAQKIVRLGPGGAKCRWCWSMDSKDSCSYVWGDEWPRLHMCGHRNDWGPRSVWAEPFLKTVYGSNHIQMWVSNLSYSSPYHIS